MNKTKVTSLAVVFTTAAILCSCTVADQSSDHSDSTIKVTSGQMTEILTSSESTSQPQDSSTQASKTTATKHDVSFSQVGDFRKINIPEYISNLGELTAVSDKVICGVTGIIDNDGKCSHDQLGFIDISSGGFFLIPLPEGIEIRNIRKGSGDILCNVEWYYRDYADDEYNTITGFHMCMVKIKKDYSFETYEDCSMSDIAFDFNGHKICQWAESIYDLSSGVEKRIVEGVPTESNVSKMGKYCSFLFGIDENRFAYKISGYESMPGLGVYDFSSGISTFLPDTENKNPIGTYNGKIFSVSSVLQTGCGSKIYVTDTDTMTTSLLTDICESDGGTDVIISMSEDGRRIAAIINRHNTDGTCTPELCILDSSDGHIIISYDISDLNKNWWDIKFIDNTTIIIEGNDSYIMDIE